ncbi:DNA repair protein RecO [Marinirhabdus gelatinilytica]|uniref:DNA repair protein RecO n=1 Tax=Marinirhabdus gelatinilytica TaxID=1703343 RepID=A0A370QJW7_9FLAO|nr:DNA repair protein RecO [Marinirhabdus gelatinilytica]RDK88665.1 DNA replication and repair protein RecO [Marinirhabdus gelatinilytica]
MVVATRAIVLSSLKYAEADLIAHCYTLSDGRKSYLLRRILKSKKGALKPSLFQPLTQLELIAKHKNKGTLETIKEAKIYYPYKTLHTDVVKTSVVMFLSEVLRDAIQEEEANPNLYGYLSQSLNFLDGAEDFANFHIYFLLNLTQYLGFFPDASESKALYFNLLEGNFQHTATNNYCEEGEHVTALKRFFGINFEALSQIKLNKKTRLEVLHLLIRYYQLHLQGFKKPKSLAVLNQLFQ